MGRDDVWVPNRGVDVDSHPRRAGYSWGNFSVMPGPHWQGHERSLGPGFPPAPLAFKGAVSPAFALALYGGFLTRLSRALGTPDIFSGVCRPSQTAHLPLSPRHPGGKRRGGGWVVFHGRIRAARRPPFIAPTYAMHPPPRRNDRLQ